MPILAWKYFNLGYSSKVIFRKKYYVTGKNIKYMRYIFMTYINNTKLFWRSGLLSQYFGFLDGTIDGHGRPGGNG